jgi:hypothetical protein
MAMNFCSLDDIWKSARANAKVITLCLWRRPKYTREVLNALRNCRGIGDYLLLIQQDGADDRGDVGQSEVRAICEKIDFAPARIVSESEHLGCNMNTRRALATGFRYADYVIHIEDDIQVAPDALQYFEWARQFRSDPSVFVVSIWEWPGFGEVRTVEQNTHVKWHPGLSIWGFATWRDRWQQMDQGWTSSTDDKAESWDQYLETHVKGDHRGSLCPMVSRCINIGSEDGTHCGDHLLPYWAGSLAFHRRNPPTYQKL